MRIAQVSPLYESVPPKLYGGTERVVSYLTEELVREGHDVTLFASGDSVTSAHLVPGSPRSLRLDESSIDPIAHHVLMLETVFQEAHDFDIVHFHIDYLHFPMSRLTRLAQITTLHGRLDIPDLAPLYKEFDDMPVVSISNAQREPLPFANWQGTVYHGLPKELLTCHSKGGDYLAFIGRISPEKRVDRAIEIAKRAGMKLKIAAKVSDADQKYYEEVIKPLLDDPLVEFIGEIGDAEKDEFLGNAYAFIFPIDWPEPFGLAMVESMATGTPVIAFSCGSVPEVVEDGVTGFIVDNIDQAVKAVAKVAELDRTTVRRRFEERFSSEKMAEGYLAIYEKIIEARERPVYVPDVAGLAGFGALSAQPAYPPALSPPSRWDQTHYNPDGGKGLR